MLYPQILGDGFRYVEEVTHMGYCVRLFDTNDVLVYVSYPRSPYSLGQSRMQAKKRALGQ